MKVRMLRSAWHKRSEFRRIADPYIRELGLRWQNVNGSWHFYRGGFSYWGGDAGFVRFWNTKTGAIEITLYDPSCAETFKELLTKWEAHWGEECVLNIFTGRVGAGGCGGDF